MTNWTERAEKAANFLADTDKQIAELKVEHERAKRKSKAKWSAIFMRVEGNVEARKAQAENHTEHKNAEEEEMRALLAYESLKNQRETASTIIDFWRSYNKAQQEGHI